VELINFEVFRALKRKVLDSLPFAAPDYPRCFWHRIFFYQECDDERSATGAGIFPNREDR